MFTRKLFIKILAAVMVIAVACNVLKKEEPDQDIIMFLNGFQSSLSKSDEVILGYFDAHQSKESILSAIRILQNKEHEFIACSVGFADAAISREEAGIRVTMPAHFASQNIDGDFQESATITFWLKPKKKSFVITKLEGEEFYNAFTSIRGEMEWKVETAREFKKREAIYTQAKTLQQQYDSVIWYTTYDQKNYFYVIKGTWNIGEWSTTLKTKPGNYTMGLVSEQGASIIPAAYDLIGTIGFDVPGLVEIKKNGKVGYFNLETQQQIVEPLYDMIIPYTADNSFALVKQDTLYGWIDHAFQYHEGFPSAAAEQLVDKYEFLPKNLVLKGDAKAFCEIPNQEYMGAGIIMPPSYMVTTGILSEIVSGISTAEVPLNAWTEYIATGSTMLESITDKIQAVVTTINERYIEGREEFYTYDRLVLVNHQHDTLAVSDINSSSKINFHKLNDTLLELQYESNQPEGSDFDEFNIPAYTYFRLNAGTAATPCTSHRRFPQSQFVKLDSSYLSGDFKRYTDKGEENVSFLSLATVTYIRNEILADYGYSFPGSEIAENYKYYKWYKPQFDKEEDLQDLLTEEDRHNLAFLAKIISLLQGGKAV